MQQNKRDVTLLVTSHHIVLPNCGAKCVHEFRIRTFSVCLRPLDVIRSIELAAMARHSLAGGSAAVLTAPGWLRTVPRATLVANRS